jgi:hypothetical protein
MERRVASGVQECGISGGGGGSALWRKIVARPRTSALAAFEDTCLHWRRRIFKEKREARVPRRASSGEERFDRVVAMFETVNSTRSEWQRRLHMEMLRAVLFQVLGRDYDSHVKRVCERMGWQGPHQELMIIASRRSGKTVGTAIFAAAVLLCVPNIEIVIFSLSKRQSDKMLALIAKFVLGTELGQAMLSRLSVERLELRGNEGPTDTRIALAFPGRSDVRMCVRGVRWRVRGLDRRRRFQRVHEVRNAMCATQCAYHEKRGA